MLSLRNTRASVHAAAQSSGERSHTLIRIQVLFRCILAHGHGRSPGPRAMPAGPRPGRRDVDMMCARLDSGARSPLEPDWPLT
jgi:hypothetical protein